MHSIVRCSLLVAMWSSPALAGGRSTYTAFDLAGPDGLVTPVPAGAAAGASLSQAGCVAVVKDGALRVQPPKDHECAFVFAQPRPSTLQLELQVGNSVQYATLAFDDGMPGVVTATFNQSNHGFDLADPKAAGWLAYYSRSDQKWQRVKLAGGFAAVSAGDEIASGEAIYYQPAGRPEVIRVNWSVKVDKPAPHPRAEPCAAVGVRHDWEIYVDAANEVDSLGLVDGGPRPQLVVLRGGNVATTSLDNFVIEPNTFGVVVVRHWSTEDVTFTPSSTPAVATPPILNGQATSTPPGGGATATSVGLTPPTVSVCSFQPVPARAPGPFTVKVQLVSSAEHSKVVSERTIDLLVEQRYSGAFRVGIAAIALAPDQKFAAETFPGSGQAEIVRVSRTPLELVIAYSQYFDGFGKGRRYGKLADPDCWLTHHFGVYFGVGALSLSNGNLDFLKSVHLGVEYELNPNLAVALTGVVRRVDEIADDLHVGAPAPTAGVPTHSVYVTGVAVVLNINPSFFRFATQLGK